SARQCIERAFGQVCLEFPILKHGISLRSVEDSVATIKACLILHNVRKAWSEPVNLQPLPTPVAANEMQTEGQAVEYVQRMGNDMSGDCLPTDRTQDAVWD